MSHRKNSGTLRCLSHFAGDIDTIYCKLFIIDLFRVRNFEDDKRGWSTNRPSQAHRR